MKSLKSFTLLSLVIFLLINCSAQSPIEINSTEAFSMLQKEKKLVVIDVRTAEEFNSGHIKGAINIDIRQPNALHQIDKLDHNSKYIVHCRTKNRSKVAVDHMVKNGFKSIYFMTDGFAGWTSNNFEMEK